MGKWAWGWLVLLLSGCAHVAGGGVYLDTPAYATTHYSSGDFWFEDVYVECQYDSYYDTNWWYVQAYVGGPDAHHVVGVTGRSMYASASQSLSLGGSGPNWSTEFTSDFYYCRWNPALYKSFIRRLRYRYIER